MRNTSVLMGGGLALALGITLAAARVGGATPQATTLRAMYGLEPPRALVAPRTALVLIDIQNELVDGRLPLPGSRAAIARAAELARWAHRSAIQLVLVRNVIARPGAPAFAAGTRGSELVAELAPQPGDLVIEKTMAGAFSSADFERELRARGIDTLLVGGFMTHLAVLTTAIDAGVRGYHVLVIADATATRDLPGAAGQAPVDAATLQRAALAALADRFADVLPSQQIMALPVLASAPAPASGPEPR